MSGPQLIPEKSKLPRELVNCPAWVVWRSQKDDGKDKPRKVPYYVDGSPRGKGTTLDSPEDVARLAKFDEALQRAKSDNYSGVGFAPREQLGIGSLDLDSCLDIAGVITDDIAFQVYNEAKAAGCYCETSPSGRGLRIFGSTEGFKNFNRGGYEAYSCNRYLTVTGNCRDNPAGWGVIDGAVRLLSNLVPASVLKSPTTSAEGLAALGDNISKRAYVAPDKVAEGGRNDAVLRQVSHLRGSGVPEHLIPEALHDFNRARCVPPLQDDEVNDIARRYQKLPISADASDWPQPKDILPGLPSVKPFDAQMLPEVFRAYVKDQSELMQVPQDFIAVSLIVSAAAVLGNGWAIAPKALDESWLVPPVLWGGLIGRPGVKKTAAMNKGTAFLREVEANMRAAYQLRLQQYQADRVAYEVSVSKFKGSIKKGGLVELLPPEPIRPEPERLVVNDTTVQKIGVIHQSSPRGLLLVKDELVGHLESLNMIGQETARTFYLDAWNGTSRCAIDRIGRGSIVIERLAVWIIGGIQPAKIHAYVRQATSGGGSDDGLIQRFQLLVWPEVSKNWKIIDRPQDKAAAETARKAIIRLRTLDPKIVGATAPTDDKPAFLHFSEEAQFVFDEMWTKIECTTRKGTEHPALESHFAKYPSLFAALALVIHLVDGGVGPVTRHAVIIAGQWVNYLKSHAQRVYASATNSAAMAAFALAEKITTGKLVSGFSARDVERKGWSKLASGEDVKNAIDWLTDADWLREVKEPTAGHPKVTYAINPRVTLVANK